MIQNKTARAASDPGEIAKLNEVFHEAARKGDTEALVDALDKGAMLQSGDKTGWPALSKAAWAGHTETAIALMDRGAELTASDSNGWTAMHWAAWMGNKETLAAILDRDESLIHATCNKDWTPLHKAAAGGHTDIVVDLLERGADIDAQTKDGLTPLDYAEQDGKDDTAAKLREIISLRNAQKTMALRKKSAGKPNT